jgi:hypothetical protein
MMTNVGRPAESTLAKAAIGCLEGNEFAVICHPTSVGRCSVSASLWTLPPH